MSNASLNSFISVINRLQNHVTTAGLPPMAFNLPQIVVVGAQSAGKSSVLENFVGREFLPRGDDIVTRRPLVLQMVHDANEEYGVFLHDKPPRKFTDFSEIRAEIEAETERQAPGIQISDMPINLEIHSPNVPDLTLVDLPGLTLVPVGDQPDDIKQQIRDIALRYAQAEHALILAVSAADVDLANSAGLDLARTADPQIEICILPHLCAKTLGENTIGVITKIDLAAAAGKDLRKTILNKLFKLKHGYYGVINKSRDEEREFFARNAAYRDPAIAKQCGTPKLQAALVDQLSIHIRQCLPKLRADLQKQLDRMESEVEEYRQYDAETLPGHLKELNNIMRSLAGAFGSSIKAASGMSTSKANSISTTSLDTGARISNLFHVAFLNDLKAICDEIIPSAKFNKEISFAICNADGLRTIMYPNPSAFEALIKERIELMRAPCMRCVDDVVEELRKTFERFLEAPKISSVCNIGRCPTLRNEVERRFDARLTECQYDVKRFIGEFLDCQIASFNTNHKDFVKYDKIAEETDAGNEMLARVDYRQLVQTRLVQQYQPQTFSTSTSSEPIYSPNMRVGEGVGNNDGDLDDASGFRGGRGGGFGGEGLSRGSSAFRGGRGYSYRGVGNQSRPRIVNDPPEMRAHVHKLRVMMQSYMRIMQETLHDQVPKFVVKKLIFSAVDFLAGDLSTDLQAAVSRYHSMKKRAGTARGGLTSGKADSSAAAGKDERGSDDDDCSYFSTDEVSLNLMDEAGDLAEQREETLRLYEATRKALHIVNTALPTTKHM